MVTQFKITFTFNFSLLLIFKYIMKRDLYIDFAKGFATLAIIFIHTVFWSGQFYVPTELRVLSLLIDVPLFFALSGLTSWRKCRKDALSTAETPDYFHDFRDFSFLLGLFF